MNKLLKKNKNKSELSENVCACRCEKNLIDKKVADIFLEECFHSKLSKKYKVFNLTHADT